MVSGRLRSQWQQTGTIAAIVYNSTGPEHPLGSDDFGPFATQKREQKPESKIPFDVLAKTLEAVGCKVEKCTAPDWLVEEVERERRENG